MEGQRTLTSPVKATQHGDIRDRVSEILERVKDKFVAAIQQFTATEVTPLTTFDFEEVLVKAVRELGREVEQWVFNSIEPIKTSEMPGTIKHPKRSYRRLADKSPNPHIVTPFGRVCLTRARYRQGRAGRMAFPLEIALGIDQGFTPAAADMVGQQFATCGSSQGRTIDAIQERTGAKIGAEKLRNLVSSLAAEMEPHRQECQLDQLMEWVKQAREAGKSPVIAVSRDGVSLGIASLSSFEMASVATISVISEGKKLGTVYLGRAPETNQKTLSAQLTSLLKATVTACGEAVPDIANALKFGKDKQHRQDWLQQMRKALLEPGGWGRVMRSIAKMKSKYKYKSVTAQQAKDAEKYLRRYQRFMNYYELREQDYPIGSGIVESACKQVVSERLKLSGMRWEHEGSQQTITLRCILLSKIWNKVYRKRLGAKPPVNDLINEKVA